MLPHTATAPPSPPRLETCNPPLRPYQSNPTPTPPDAPSAVYRSNWLGAVGHEERKRAAQAAQG